MMRTSMFETMDLQAVQAEAKDAERLAQIHVCSWKEAYRGIIADEVIAGFASENRSEIFSQAIARNEETYYLFKINGKSAGFASIYKSHEENVPADLGEIYAIYFHPDFWGTAITQYGLDFCIDRLKAMGFTRIAIWVLEGNLRARKFYEKNGFSFDGNATEINLGKLLRELRYSKSVE